jgi:hypothetical protein
MGFFDKLFGKKPSPTPDPRLAEILAHPPRLINEGPEFPVAPIVMRRSVTPAQVESTLTGAGFTRTGDTWARGGLTITPRTVFGTSALEFSGDGVLEAKRELLTLLPWIDPGDGLYAATTDPKTPIPDVLYLLGAIQNYRCAGGIPAELRRHPSPEIQEAIRLADRERMAATAREQRARKKGR